ncbi:MAG: Hsp20/alpha crystallin family protein [Chloroflexi bacterium]|nr:MAG: Hsp20/alpha crystallin family protein [Chloroflexota bacterium]MBL1197404.1 Hsp20/alpha crystallin family protein [Chloroflexota bacterium]NOH14700.1 Hsp20/alpha crystallin family protein [Chloroflexota bacterium]
MMKFYVSPRRRARMARLADARSTAVHIPVDVIAEDDAFELTAYVPGVSADELEIEVLDDTVYIAGEFAADEDEDVSYLLRERPRGSFSRTLRLPSALDADGAQAEVKDGILNLHVPVAEQAKTKKIAVKSN